MRKIKASLVGVFTILVALFIYKTNSVSDGIGLSANDLANAIQLSTSAKVGVAEYYAINGYFPNNNGEAGLPPADSIYGSKVKRVSVLSGGIIRADFHHELGSKSIMLRPIEPNTSWGHIAWICVSDTLSGRELMGFNGHCKHEADTKERELMRAVENQNIKRISVLLDERVDPNIPSYGATPLILSVRNGYAEIAKILIENNANVDTVSSDSRGMPALTIAVINGDIDLVKLLLRSGAKIHKKDTSGKSALDYAKKSMKKGVSNSTEIVALLDGARDTYAQNQSSDSTYRDAVGAYDELISAVDKCDESRVEQILPMLEGDLDSETIIAGVSPFSHAIKSGCVAIVRNMITLQDFSAGSRNAALVEAIKYTHQDSLIGMLEALFALEQGEDLTNDVSTILQTAIILDRPQAAEYLIENFDSVEWSKQDHDKPLIEACKKDYTSLAIKMVKNGVSVDGIDGKGVTPLAVAAKNGNEEIVISLINAGARVDSKDHFGRTPLMEATQKREERTVRLLLENGASPFITDKNNVDALSIARSKRYDKIVDILRRARRDIHMSNGASF